MKKLAFLGLCAVAVVGTLVYLLKPNGHPEPQWIYREDDDGIQPMDIRAAIVQKLSNA